MTFFKTLLRPDRDDDSERSAIAQAANLLQVGEFQLLQLAYAEWFGEDMDEATSSAVFEAFMRQGQMPAWARHYARKILDMERQGVLDDIDPRYHRFDNDYFRSRLSDGTRRFLVAATIVVGALGGGIAMASYVVERGGMCTNHLPPCVTQQEIELPPARQM